MSFEVISHLVDKTVNKGGVDQIINYMNTNPLFMNKPHINKETKHEPSIRNIVSISKPSCRVYFSLKNIWKLESGVSLVIFSTNKGVCSTKLCKQLKIGGEPLIHLN